jgi:2-oxoglutarate ferredoxin oxidoreductase subunit beta
MIYYKEHSKVKNGCPTSEVGLGKTGDIIVGKFVDRERSDYRDLMHERLQETLGDRYVEREACECEI